MPFIIDDEMLINTSAEVKMFFKGDTVAREGECSSFFLYLKSGELSVFNFTQDGKEFLQHKVIAGNFCGEPAVLLEKPFPGHVEVASEKATLVKFKRDRLIAFLLENPERMLDFTISVAEKSIRKSHSLKNIVFLNPEERILHQLRDYKKEHKCCPTEKMLISLTRKEISHMTGLRIETIIRTVKKMEKEGKLEIKSGKIYL